MTNNQNRPFATRPLNSDALRGSAVQILCFELGIYLGFGAWDLGFPPSQRIYSRNKNNAAVPTTPMTKSTMSFSTKYG
jgi:hypothetical protein